MGDKLKLFGWHLGDLLYHLRNQGCNLGTSGVTWKPKKCHDDAMYSKPHVLLWFFDMLIGSMRVHMDTRVVHMTCVLPMRMLILNENWATHAFIWTRVLSI